MTAGLYPLILQRMADVKDDAIASAMGCERTKIVKIRSCEHGVKLTDMEAFFSALGLKVVGEDGQVVDTAELHAWMLLVRNSIDKRLGGK